MPRPCPASLVEVPIREARQDIRSSPNASSAATFRRYAPGPDRARVVSPNVEVFRPRLISIRRELLSPTNSRNVKGDDSTEGSSPLALSHGCRDGRSSNRSWLKI